jgi:uncharacterized membrane protein
VADTQEQDRVVTNDGHGESGVTRVTQTTADPVTGMATRRSSTSTWSGSPLGARIVELAIGIVALFLAFDFIFHAAGAANVGFGAFIFAVGTALAAPFAGIFKVTYTTPGTLFIWADVLALVVYAIAAWIVVKLVSMSSEQRAKRAA